MKGETNWQKTCERSLRRRGDKTSKVSHGGRRIEALARTFDGHRDIDTVCLTRSLLGKYMGNMYKEKCLGRKTIIQKR